MSELKEIGIRWEEDGELHFSHVYLKSEADEVIAELKAENESLKTKLETVNELVKTSKDLYGHAIESLKASHDTEVIAELKAKVEEYK